MARSTSLLTTRTTTSVFGAARASFTTIHLTRTVQHSRTPAMPLIGGDRAAPRRFSFASTSASTCGPEKALHQKIAQRCQLSTRQIHVVDPKVQKEHLRSMIESRLFERTSSKPPPPSKKDVDCRSAESPKGRQ